MKNYFHYIFYTLMFFTLAFGMYYALLLSNRLFFEIKLNHKNKFRKYTYEKANATRFYID